MEVPIRLARRVGLGVFYCHVIALRIVGYDEWKGVKLHCATSESFLSDVGGGKKKKKKPHQHGDAKDQKRFRIGATGLPPVGSLCLSSSIVRQSTFFPLPCESAALKRVCHPVTDPFFLPVCGNDCSLFRKVCGT